MMESKTLGICKRFLDGHFSGRHYGRYRRFYHRARTSGKLYACCFPHWAMGKSLWKTLLLAINKTMTQGPSTFRKLLFPWTTWSFRLGHTPSWKRPVPLPVWWWQKKTLKHGLCRRHNRAVSRLPGISASDYTSKFAIRGGEADEVLISVDGMELYEPFHQRDYSGGLFNIVDIETIGGSIWWRGFSAEYGNRLSGAFNMRTKSIKDNESHTKLSLKCIERPDLFRWKSVWQQIGIHRFGTKEHAGSEFEGHWQWRMVSPNSMMACSKYPTLLAKNTACRPIFYTVGIRRSSTIRRWGFLRPVRYPIQQHLWVVDASIRPITKNCFPVPLRIRATSTTIVLAGTTNTNRPTKAP